MSAIPSAVRARVRQKARNRCGYCRSHQQYVLGILQVEHIIPKVSGGSDDEENLWLACSMCNNAKHAQTHAMDPLTRQRVRVFNPRKQRWQRHFRWSSDGVRILGRTACGRATVAALNMNNLISVTVRQKWIEAAWHPPRDE
ncbi:MAG: HNH endonuclease [Armatimonadetes bacterium]|nr:HNH endonuclease [Armatimonadota bacterium]